MQRSEQPIVFGAPYSVYVGAVRLALEEKGVHYELVPSISWRREGHRPNTWHDPIRKNPAFEHAGFRLYEAGAITRYVDEAFSDLSCNRKTRAVAPG